MGSIHCEKINLKEREEILTSCYLKVICNNCLVKSHKTVLGRTRVRGGKREGIYHLYFIMIGKDFCRQGWHQTWDKHKLCTGKE